MNTEQPYMAGTGRRRVMPDDLKDETCPKCNTFFAAHIHWIKCDADDCPMKSKTEKRTLLEQFVDGDWSGQGGGND